MVRPSGRVRVHVLLLIFLCALLPSCANGVQEELFGLRGYPDEHPRRLLVRIVPGEEQAVFLSVTDALQPERSLQTTDSLGGLVQGLWLLEFGPLADMGTFEAKLQDQLRSAAAPSAPVLYWERDPRTQIASSGVRQDSLRPVQWQHRAPDAPGVEGALGYLEPVWDQLAGTGLPGASVAVLDCGVMPSHPDFSEAFGPLRDFASEEGGKGLDLHPHGNAVASLIGARRQPGTDGMVGVAPTATLHVYRVLNEGQGWLGDALLALQAAVGNGLRVSCNAWYTEQDSQAFVDCLAGAGAQGHLFVTAATNFGQALHRDTGPYPASYGPLPALLTVGAIDRTGTRAPFSNYGNGLGGGPAVELAAPGVDVIAALPPASWSTDSGTSYAAAHVAGALALGLSAREARGRSNGAQSLSLAQIRQALESSVRSIPSAEDFAWGGALDAPALVEALLALP